MKCIRPLEVRDNQQAVLSKSGERSYLFTSESVSAGHPDKLADRISDTILDRFLCNDSLAKVACETFIANDLVVVAGEFHTDLFQSIRAQIPDLIRQVIRDTGYTRHFPGIDPDACEIRLQLNEQSGDIRQGVDTGGAGDQGLVFGYATDETPEMMPLPIVLAHKLMQRQAQLRASGAIPWLRPDAKSQVTVRYHNDKPIAVETVVTAEQIQTMRDVLDHVYCDEKVGDYIIDVVFATRKPSDYGMAIDHQIEYGASPRATLYLNLAARANAMLMGRAYATPQDVKDIAHDVLRHRLILTYEAEAEEVTSEAVIDRILNEIPVP